MIDVVYIADSKYVMPSCVSVVSLISNMKNESIHVHFFAVSLSEDEKKMIMACEMSNATIEIMDVDVNKYAEILKSRTPDQRRNYVSASAMVKFEIANLLSDLDRVLYLDGDTIIQNDLSELFDTDISDIYLAAIDDMGDKKDSNGYSCNAKRLGLKQTSYFNSGVLLLNLKRIRTNDISQQLVEFRRNKVNHFVDQDAFNYVCANQWLSLPFKYNFRTAIFDRHDMDEVNAIMDANYIGIDDCIENQSILHCSDYMKPWTYNLPWFTDIFRKYYEKSPYARIELNLKSPLKEIRDVFLSNEDGMEFRFPYEKIHRRSRVVLYGAGNVGKQFMFQNSKTCYCDFIAWVDRNFETYNGEVQSPKVINNLKYDYILIAVFEERFINEIRNILIAEFGISNEKIVSIRK